MTDVPSKHGSRFAFTSQSCVREFGYRKLARLNNEEKFKLWRTIPAKIHALNFKLLIQIFNFNS